MTKLLFFPAWFALLLAGCNYNPAPESGAQACDLAGSHPCPNGYFCARGTCWRNGDTPRGGAGGTGGFASGRGGSGGTLATGGTRGTGGIQGTGGPQGTGGIQGTGGFQGTGGMTTTPPMDAGSPPVDAPVPASLDSSTATDRPMPLDAVSALDGSTPAGGGAVGTGGKPGTGGNTSAGGSTTPFAVDCPDVSTYTNSVTGQYGAATISLDGNSSKTYYMQANWWGTPFNNQTESVDGVGFTMTNSGSGVAGNNPLGFPSIFIGTYGSKRTTGSNLPKQVSALSSVPTIFSTNIDTMGSASYNAAYDVWLTSGSGVVTGSNPGSGGAYLMVWLFKPTDKQPRGTLRGNGTIVTGVKGGWDVWYDPSTDNMPCVSYVASNKVASLEFDLKYFIQDAIASGYGVTNNQYLSIIFAGFEVWGGGNGLQVKKFCANVN